MCEAEDKHPGPTGDSHGKAHTDIWTEAVSKKEKGEDDSKEATEAADRWINHGFWGCKLRPDNEEGKVCTNAVSKAKPTLT